MDANSLTVLPGGQDEDLQDVKDTVEGFHRFIVKSLKDKGEKAKCITLADVLKKPFLANLRATLYESYKKWLKETNIAKAKLRRELQTAQEKIMAEQGEELNAMFREENGLPPVLTQEEIQAKLLASAKAADNKAETSKSGVPASSPATSREELVRSRVLALREEYGSKLPDIAFESADGATEVRRVIKYCVQNLRLKRQENGLDADYLAIVNKLYYLIQNGLFPMIDKVVVEGWGLELGKSPKNNQLFGEVTRIMSDDVRFTAILQWVKNCPTPEEIKAATMTEAELAEAKAKADAEKAAVEAEKQKRREELWPVLKARLLEVDSELPGDSAEKLAKFLARSYSHMADSKAMFIAAANERNALAKKNKEDQAAVVTISRYVKAAGLTPEEFEVEYAQFTKQQGRNDIITNCVDHNGNNQPSGATSPLGHKTRGDRAARDKARRQKQEARQAADDARRPKPNQGSGDITQTFKKNKDKDGNKK